MYTFDGVSVAGDVNSEGGGGGVMGDPQGLGEGEVTEKNSEEDGIQSPIGI